MTDSDSRIARESALSVSDGALHKAHLRSRLLSARTALPATQRTQATAAIAAHLTTWLQQINVGILAVFSPIRGEPDLSDFYRQVTMHGWQLALPIVHAVDSALHFAAWTPEQTMMRDSFGVLVPAVPQRLIIPEVILMPCVGFTAQRMRLGYGGGFYDRTLADLPAARTVGIAFDCTRCIFVPEAHDLPLDAVITESGSL